MVYIYFYLIIFSYLSCRYIPKKTIPIDPDIPLHSLLFVLFLKQTISEEPQIDQPHLIHSI